MKILLLMVLISSPAFSSESELTIAEVALIDSVVKNIRRTAQPAQNCLNTLSIGDPGIECASYHLKMLDLLISINMSGTIGKEDIYLAVAHNDEWYRAYKLLDKIKIIVRKIDKLRNKILMN